MRSVREKRKEERQRMSAPTCPTCCTIATIQTILDFTRHAGPEGICPDSSCYFTLSPLPNVCSNVTFSMIPTITTLFKITTWCHLSCPSTPKPPAIVLFIHYLMLFSFEHSSYIFYLCMLSIFSLSTRM